MIIIYYDNTGKALAPCLTEHLPEPKEVITMAIQDTGEEIDYRVRRVKRRLTVVEDGVTIEMFFVNLREISDSNREN